MGDRNRNNWDIFCGLQHLLCCHHLQNDIGCFNFNLLAVAKIWDFY
jgi:hypothetical protein